MVQSITTWIKPNSPSLRLSHFCDAFVLVFLHLFPGSIWAETISLFIAAFFPPVSQPCQGAQSTLWNELAMALHQGAKKTAERKGALRKDDEPSEGPGEESKLVMNDSHSIRLWVSLSWPIPVCSLATFHLLLSLLSFCRASMSFSWLSVLFPLAFSQFLLSCPWRELLKNQLQWWGCALPPSPAPWRPPRGCEHRVRARRMPAISAHLPRAGTLLGFGRFVNEFPDAWMP